MLDENFIKLWNLHRPSKRPFFDNLAAASTTQLISTGILETLYERYQAAMHSSRVMAYFLPHLDSVELRVLKIKVLADDDLAPNGDTHHYQLRRTWTQLMGHAPKMQDHEFGELSLLKFGVDPSTAEFISLVQEIYPKSLGPWVMVEGLAHDWIGALLHGLMPHFPSVEDSDYVRENYLSKIEIDHAGESLETTIRVIERNPDLLEATLDGASKMGRGLDKFWDSLNDILVSLDAN